jgi:hypothetical protein
MVTGKLLGIDSPGGGSLADDNFRLSKFTAVATGTVTEIRVYGTANGQVKVAVYTDDGGEPGALIVANNTGQLVTASQWNILTITQFSVTKDTAYWLAANMGTDAAITTGAAGTGQDRYKGAEYDTFSFPDPAEWNGSNTRAYDMAAWGVLVVTPSGVSQPLSSGSPKLNLLLKPSGIEQPLCVATPEVAVLALVIYPTGIAQPVDVGTTSVIYRQVISPPGIAQPVAVGEPWLGGFGFVKPTGTGQQTSIGSPALLKYVWHVVLDGRYIIDSPDVNRSYVIGRDQYGIPVYGTAVDSTELGLVGERLDFRQEPAISTDDQAAYMAGAVLSKMRLTGKKGVIVIPPNCGQELFDVVQITDAGANQEGVRFRVAGVRFEYDPGRAVYQHTLFLAAP